MISSILLNFRFFLNFTFYLSPNGNNGEDFCGLQRLTRYLFLLLHSLALHKVAGDLLLTRNAIFSAAAFLNLRQAGGMCTILQKI